ncbi:MAG: RNA polymerase sigma factor [Bacteroidota bacterium]|nr:RNA polymerase sigma factor [Bacteroidota bacterium]
MINSDDQEYIHKVLSGDMNAFAVLVDRYKNMVFRLCLKMINNREDAEELTQDSFIKVYRSLKQFKGESRFSTWLYKIVYYTCLDRLKKLKRERQMVTINTFSVEQIAALQTDFEQLEEKKRKELVQECLQLLPEEDSFLLTLYYLEEQSVKEIAQIIGATESNIKVKLFRSRNKLTTLLQAQTAIININHYATE